MLYQWVIADVVGDGTDENPFLPALDDVENILGYAGQFDFTEKPYRWVGKVYYRDRQMAMSNTQGDVDGNVIANRLSVILNIPIDSKEINELFYINPVGNV